MGDVHPAEAVEQIQATWRDLGTSPLVQRVCVAALGILESPTREWDLYVRDLLALRCVIDPDLPEILSWFVGWVWESPDSTKERLSEDGYGADLLEAGVIAISRGALTADEAITKIARPVFRASSEPARLLEAGPLPTTPETLKWSLAVLEEAISFVPQAVVVEVGAALLSRPEVAEIPDSGIAVAERTRLLALLASHAPFASLEPILALARPDFDAVGPVLLDRLNRDGCDESVDRWARLLASSGFRFGRYADASLEEHPHLAEIFASEVWRWHGPEWYEVLAGWLAQPGALEDPADLALRLITSRDGQDGLPPAEVRLLGVAIRVVGAHGRLNQELGMALAKTSSRSRGATLQWALAWSSTGGAQDDTRQDVPAAFSRCAAEQVRQQETPGPTPLRDGVRVAWAEHRLSGRESFVSPVLADRHASTGHRLLELLETCPPPAVYSSARAWGERASPFGDLHGGEAAALRARMMLVAPSLSRLYDRPGERSGWGIIRRLRSGGPPTVHDRSVR